MALAVGEATFPLAMGVETMEVVIIIIMMEEETISIRIKANTLDSKQDKMVEEIVAVNKVTLSKEDISNINNNIIIINNNNSINITV